MRKLESWKTSILFVVAFAWSGAAEADDTNVRMLHFPADRAVGTVHQRPRYVGSYAHSKYDFVVVGDARGDVAVPRDADVRLDVGKIASTDLSFLQQLQPDDVQVLRLRETDVTDEQLEHVGALTGLRVIDLEQTRITDAGIKHFSRLEKLQEINLEAFRVHEQGFGVGDEAMAVLGGLPELESVSLRLTKVTDAGLEQLVRAKKLRHVGLEGTQATDAGMASLARLPRLEMLELGVYDEGAPVTDQGLEYIGELVNLKHLDLSGTKVTDDGLPALARLVNLESLGLQSTKVTEAGLAHLKPLKSLQRLRFYRDITDAGAAHLAELKSLRQISSNMELTDEGVASLSNLPNLEELSLKGDAITDACMPHIAKMKSLKNLWFQDCPITDRGLAQLTGLKNINRMLISNTNVTGDGIESLRQLPELKTLHLDFGSRDEAYRCLEPHLHYVGQLKSLTKLDLEGERVMNSDLAELTGLIQLENLEIDGIAVDDRAAIDLAGLTSLTSLSIADSVLTDRGLSQLSNLRRLEYLQLKGHFTKDGLVPLQRIKSLRSANLSSPYITDDDVKQLALANPALQRAGRWDYDEPLEISVSDRDMIRRYGLREDRVEKDALEGLAPPALHLAGWLNTEDQNVTLDSFRGKVVLVDFWGTWCGPCVASMPKLQSMVNKYGEQGFVVVGVHTTRKSEELPSFVEQRSISWPVASDVDDQSVGNWKVESYPSYYLIDRDGKLRMAGIYRSDLERAVLMLLNETAATNATSPVPSK